MAPVCVTEPPRRGNDSMGFQRLFRLPPRTQNSNPESRLGPSKLQMDHSREISMPHARQVRTRPPIGAGAAVALLALALACAVLPTRAADTPPTPATDAALK